MSYGQFLIIFLVIPTIILSGIRAYIGNRYPLPNSWRIRPSWIPLTALAFIAFVYTTPWDNYLVATSVWWYDPALVLGVTLGWVPVEEYLFFILQPIFTGVCLLLCAQVLTKESSNLTPSPQIRRLSIRIASSIWVVVGVIWLSGWLPGTYLALELLWAIPPLMVQLAFGADIIWHYRYPVLTTLGLTTLYLGLADSYAISTGIWTIDPSQSLHLMIGGILPIEELLFFGLTNMLVVFGVVLLITSEGQQRLEEYYEYKKPLSLR